MQLIICIGDICPWPLSWQRQRESIQTSSMTRWWQYDRSRWWSTTMYIYIDHITYKWTQSIYIYHPSRIMYHPSRIMYHPLCICSMYMHAINKKKRSTVSCKWSAKKRHKHPESGEISPQFQVTKSIELHSLTSLGWLSSRGNGFDFFCLEKQSVPWKSPPNVQVFCGVD